MGRYSQAQNRGGRSAVATAAGLPSFVISNDEEGTIDWEVLIPAGVTARIEVSPDGTTGWTFVADAFYPDGNYSIDLLGLFYRATVLDAGSVPVSQTSNVIVVE